MASKNVKNWEEPLFSSSKTDNLNQQEEEQEKKSTNNVNYKLEAYVKHMAYRPVPPPKLKPRLETLALPNNLTLLDTCIRFENVLDPALRKQRLKHLTGKYTALTTEQLESIIKQQNAKETKQSKLNARKQELYYELLTKLETQCRIQYLNVLMKKFAHFMANLATRMHIPAQLTEPYARMHRSLVTNIFCIMGLQPMDPAAFCFNTAAAKEFAVCHNLAHAFLSLIIKALDCAAVMNPDEIETTMANQFEMDSYIKQRLMCAAEKKVENLRMRSKSALNFLPVRKCVRPRPC